MKKTLTARLTRAGIIASLYIAISTLIMPISSGPIQFRVSEGLCLLPLFFIEAIPGLFVGCLISNVIAGCLLPDIFLGSLITLISAFLTWFIGKVIKNKGIRYAVGGIFPVILNAFFLPLIWLAFTGEQIVYIVNVCYLLISQTASVYAVGVPIGLVIEKKLLDKSETK